MIRPAMRFQSRQRQPFGVRTGCLTPGFRSRAAPVRAQASVNPRIPVCQQLSSDSAVLLGRVLELALDLGQLLLADLDTGPLNRRLAHAK